MLMREFDSYMKFDRVLNKALDEPEVYANTIWRFDEYIQGLEQGVGV